MTTGFIFDIQRCCLHDGPGIRTAVFFKGCPLHCLWCHNPESQSRGREISFRPEACAACGECVVACPNSAHRIIDGVHIYNRLICKQCGDCVRVCMYEALKAAGEEQTVESVMAVVRRDLPFYKQSGGGITLTGGEPMFQPDFTIALLEVAKTENIHTCLETNGLVNQQQYERVLPFVDLFLYDIKVIDPDFHRQWTGASNDIILSNLDFLYKNGAIIRLRCPLVPGVNDTPEHLAGIAALDRRYPHLDGIDLLPYHNIGNSKYERYGLVNPLPGLGMATDTVKLGWLNTLRGLECMKAVIG